MTHLVVGKPLQEWASEFPLLNDLRDYKEVTWVNERRVPCDQALGDVGLTLADIDDAADRLKRFAPLIQELFPDTKST